MRVLHEANVVEVERGSREYAEPLFLRASVRHSAGNSRESALQALTAKAK